VTAKTRTSPAVSKMALVVHSDLNALSGLQSALSERGYVTVVARDLPTALLAITQHYFEIAIVSSRLDEGGDGWPLAGVLHMVFPGAFVAVISPTEPDVLTLQSAINYGVREVYQQSVPSAEVVGAILTHVEQGSGRASRKARVQ
jgi:DNA-binding NtrC family response regulator